jgi:hypothetical protein
MHPWARLLFAAIQFSRIITATPFAKVAAQLKAATKFVT